MADSSIWIDHFRFSDAHLAGLVEKRILCCHPAVIGEIACGTITQRSVKLQLMHQLRQSAIASAGEVLQFIEKHTLMGRGVGYVDMQLLSSAAIDGNLLWTRDRRLREVAESLGLSY